jgi:hypothetical protein
MASFDPDKYLSKKKAFDPDQYLGKAVESVSQAVPIAAERFPSEALRLAKDPQVQANVLRYGLPIAAGALTGGAGALPAIGMAGVAGAGAEGLAQVREQVAGLETAPKTSTEAATKIAKEGALNALFEGVGRGAKALGGKVVGAVKGWAAKRGAAQSTGATADELARIYEMHPEVTKPGYFKERIDTFTSDLDAKLAAKKKLVGSQINDALKASEDKPAMMVSDLRKSVDEGVEELGLIAKTKEARLKLKELYRMVDEIEKKGAGVEWKDLADFERAMYRATKNAPSDVARAPSLISRRLDDVFAKNPKLVKARRAYRELMQDEEVLQQAFGASSKPDPKDLSKAGKASKAVQEFLGYPEETKQIIREATDRLPGNVTERLEKLAAAGGGEGRLTASQPLLPSMGAGNIGYIQANPAAGTAALTTTAAIRAAKSAPVVRGLFRAATSAPVKNVLLPGLGQAGQVIRATRAAINTKKKK